MLGVDSRKGSRVASRLREPFPVICFFRRFLTRAVAFSRQTLLLFAVLAP